MEPPFHDIVLNWREAGVGDVRVGGEVGGALELGIRRAVLEDAVHGEMQEWSLVRRSHIRVFPEIPLEIKKPRFSVESPHLVGDGEFLEFFGEAHGGIPEEIS